MSPSRRGMVQAIAWLNSKIAEKDSLDAINAEVCLNVIEDLKNQREKAGILIHRMKLKEDAQVHILDHASVIKKQRLDDDIW